MQIESVSEKKAGRHWLRLSDGSTLRLYPQTVVEFDLRPGRELTQEELAKIQAAAGAMSAKMRAVRIVSASAVSAKDLAGRLERKGETREDAQAAVAWMQSLNLVDDLETARQLVRRGLARGYGINRLQQMLYEKQIPKDLWDTALADLPEPDEAIDRFLDSRLGPQADRKAWKKAADALVRRGYLWQDIRRGLHRRGQFADEEPEE